MPAVLIEVTSEAELGATVDCLWDSYSEPYESFLQILFPIFEHTDKEYKEKVAASKATLWAQHIQDKSSHWVFVADSESGKVLSGAHWNFHETSPFVNGTPNLVATWYPEGEGRNFASHILNQVYGPRGNRLWRPHAQLDMMFTLPGQRGKGFGSMLMEWGINVADQMGIEVVVEATKMGMHLYKKFGLRTVEKICIDTAVDNPSNLWKKMESDFGNCIIWWMWKPHGGIYEPGKIDLPWVAKPQLL